MEATNGAAVRSTTVDASQGTRPARSSELPCGDGLFQLLVVLSAAIGSCSHLLQHRSFKITFAVMDHWCRRPAPFANVSVAEWKWLAIPLDDEGEHSRCLIRDPPDGGDGSRVVPCSSWEFDLTPYGHNAVSEWNLVCDRAWLLSLVKVVYAAVCIVTLPVTGAVADHVGRRTVIFLTIPVVLIAGVASSLPEGFYFFVVVRTIVSAGTSALVPPLFVLLYEVSPTAKFAMYNALVTLACIVMVPVTLLVAALGTSGWTSIQLMLLVPTLPTVALYYTVDESPAWLMARGFVREAERVVSRAAHMNKIRVTRCHEQFTGQSGQIWPPEQAVPEVSDFCASRFTVRTVFICYMAISITFVFATFVVNESIKTNVQTKLVSIALSAGVLLSVLLYLPLFGPKRVVVISGLLLSGATTGLAGTYTPEETGTRDVLFVVMRVTVIVAMAVLFIMILGLYSVTARSTAFGAGLSCMLIGDAISQMFSTPEHRKRLLLAVTAFATALFVAAAEYLPEGMAGPALHRRSLSDTRSSVPIGADLRRTMQESLEPLPKGPAETRAMKTPVTSRHKPKKVYMGHPTRDH